MPFHVTNLLGSIDIISGSDACGVNVPCERLKHELLTFARIAHLSYGVPVCKSQDDPLAVQEFELCSSPHHLLGVGPDPVKRY
jgi:hypothetical protein